MTLQNNIIPLHQTKSNLTQKLLFYLYSLHLHYVLHIKKLYKTKFCIFSWIELDLNMVYQWLREYIFF